jgi:hypothetical protein
VLKYFGHFDLNIHDPILKLSHICLICREAGLDKEISVGKDASPSALVSHLKAHKVQHAEYEAALDQKRKDSISSVGKSQPTMMKYMSCQASLKDNFKQKFAKWMEEDSVPLVTCRSQNFKRLVATANKHVDVPYYQTLMSHLYQVKIGAVSNSLKDNFEQTFTKWIAEDSVPLVTCRSQNFKHLVATANKHVDVPYYQTLMSHLYQVKMGAVSKTFLKGKFYSLSMDHWTSLATDNYGAIALHVIDDFQLHAFVLI